MLAPVIRDTTQTAKAPHTNVLSQRISAGVVVVTIIFTSIYVGAMLWTRRKAHGVPQGTNNGYSTKLVRYGPVVYIFLVLASLIEAATASWLLLQNHSNHNLPSTRVRNGVRFLLFTAFWTAITSSALSVLFIHPAWSTHPVSSIGSQALWSMTSWIFWVASTGTLEAAVPQLFEGATCWDLVYCQQLQALFAFGVLQILVLTFVILVILWLAWQSRKQLAQPSA